MNLRSPLSRTTLIWLAALCGAVAPLSSAQALEPFVDGSALLQNSTVTSGVAIGVTDMNNDGLDDIVRLHDGDELLVEYQQADGSFTITDFGPVGGGSSWGMALGDVNGDGNADIFTGGAYNGLKLLVANEEGNDYENFMLGGPQVFVQCVNFADIDNNGTLDLFVCNDDGTSAPFSNSGNGAFSFDTGLINAESTIPSDNSGNYGSVWTDYDNDGDLDLYVAKCRLGVQDPMDGRRVNLLFQNDGNGNYTDVAEAAGVRPLAQSWTMDFGDIDNDGDMDLIVINHNAPSVLYENLGPGEQLGTFADITGASGMAADLEAIDLGIQSHFEDFDNDTFVDLLVTGRSGQHRLFINNGDMTFTAESDPFPTGGPGVQSGAIGDLNDDGFPDLMAGFATGFNNPSSNNPDRLFINPTNDNNYINVRLTGTTSNPSAVGARVEVVGEWGTQIRDVRAGESYGITNSLIRHFGLGSTDEVESITVRWPSGQVDTVEMPLANQTVHIIEGCSLVFFEDGDGDGFGDPTSMVTDCAAPKGYVEDNTDCDDDDGDNFPGNAEVCDDSDNNCDGQADEGLECMPATTGEPTTSGPGVSGSGDSTGADDSSGGDAGATGEEDGCGCTSGGPTGPASWLALLGLLFGVRRRRGRVG